MYNDSSSPTMTTCTFSGNIATGNGGGMFNSGGSITITKCTFTMNTTAASGGAMRNWSSSPTVTDCNFSGNTAGTSGGGMYNETSSSPAVTNCNFTGNSAQHAGGIFNNDGSSPTLTNCMFSSNSATHLTTGFGGGIYNLTNSSPTLTNCTFSGNSAVEGGAMNNRATSNPNVTNCILWSDTPDEIYDDATSTTTVNYSDVEGGWLGAGGNNINADPCLVDANNPDPNERNLRLKPPSPCIDAGDTTAVPSSILVDLDGNPRRVDRPQTADTGVSILGLTVDIGAYEFNCNYTPGDNNCDGVVDFKDLAILCANWLAGK
ncbi:MAG: choice-of-anchor Q domain-containing protein [Planctomycetota bacterium]